MTTPHRLTIDLGHVRLAALSWGAPDAPLAVCLHGFPDSAWTWRHLGPVLAEAGYRVVAPFTRGYAPSDIPADGDYHVAALTYDAIALHRNLGGDDRAVLIGHDWGALTVHGVAAAADNPYRHLIAMAVPPIAAIRVATRGMRGARLTVRQLMLSWYIGFHQLPYVPERVAGRLVPFLWRRWGPTPEPTDIAGALAAVPDLDRRSAAIGYYRAMIRPRIHDRYRAHATGWLRPPMSPLCYLHGMADGCMQVELTDGLEKALPTGSRVERIAGAGHFLHLDRADDVHRHVLEYLDITAR